MSHTRCPLLCWSSAGPPGAPPSVEEEAPADYKPKTVTPGDIISLWVTNIAQTCVRARVWPFSFLCIGEVHVSDAC